MNLRPALQLLLVLTGFTLLFSPARFPHWFIYSLMLAILGGSYYLAPEWFAPGTRSRLVWWAALGIATLGLALEALSLALR